jgi:hypothetical protein
MMISANWWFAHPDTWREMKRLIIGWRKLQTHYAIWIDIPKCRM